MMTPGFFLIVVEASCDREEERGECEKVDFRNGKRRAMNGCIGKT